MSLCICYHVLYAAATKWTVRSCHHMNCTHLPPHELYASATRCTVHSCYHMCCAHLQPHVLCTHLLPGVYTIQYTLCYHMCCAHLHHMNCVRSNYPCTYCILYAAGTTCTVHICNHISVTFATTCTVRSYYHMYCAAVTTCTAPRVYTLSTPIGLKQNGDRKGCWLTASWQLVDSWWKCWRSFPLAEVTAIPLKWIESTTARRRHHHHQKRGANFPTTTTSQSVAVRCQWQPADALGWAYI